MKARLQYIMGSDREAVFIVNASATRVPCIKKHSLSRKAMIKIISFCKWNLHSVPKKGTIKLVVVTLLILNQFLLLYSPVNLQQSIY